MAESSTSRAEDKSNVPLLSDADTSSRPEPESGTGDLDPHVGAATQVQDEPSIMGIPKETIEEMMRAWSNILIQGLKKESERQPAMKDPDVELGTIPAKTNAEATRNIQVIPPKDILWTGEPIEVMTSAEINAENQQRSDMVHEWMDDRPQSMKDNSIPEFWLQSWYGSDETVYNSNLKRDTTRLQWPEPKAYMFETQITLLYLVQNTAPWVGPTLSNCKLSFIGMKLRDIIITSQNLETRLLYHREQFISPDPTIPEVRVYVAVLIEYLWLFTSIRTRGVVTINDLFTACCKRGILPQKIQTTTQGEVFDWESLAKNIAIIAFSLKCFDSWGILKFTPRGSSLTMFPSSFRKHMEQATCTKYRDDPYGLVREAARYVSMPLSVGGLKVIWTEKLDDHLGLFASGSGDIVMKLYWFENEWTMRLIDGWEAVDAQWNEANKTLLWILGSNQKGKSLKAYRNTRLPDWYCGHPDQLDPTRLKPDMCKDAKSHLKLDRWNMLPQQIPYADYPHYEKRIRELKHYMDSQAPTGLRGLWRDKRNSYSFYTLWLVVIFGGISIILALASLVVSSLQTWAAFHPPGR